MGSEGGNRGSELSAKKNGRRGAQILAQYGANTVSNGAGERGREGAGDYGRERELEKGGGRGRARRDKSSERPLSAHAIGKSGRIDGTIVAERLVVSGLFKGEVESEIIEILSGGRIEGNVLAANLVIEDGGIFEGISKRRDSGVLELKEEKVKNKKEA